MRRLQIKFPNQIRISGWDFGSSARAMNQAGGFISTQAELVKVISSTTERKSMSTKTTIKRIALVAVSALGLGVVSAIAPASASNGSDAASISLDTTSVTVVANTGATDSSTGVVRISLFDSLGAADSLASTETITAAVVAVPSVDTKTVALNAGDIAFTELAGTPGSYGLDSVTTATNGVFNVSNTPSVANANATTVTNSVYVLGISGLNQGPNSAGVMDKGYYTVRLRLTDNTGYVLNEKTFQIRWVSAAANSGAAITLATKGYLTKGETVTYTTNQYLKATVADPNGGRVQVADSTLKYPSSTAGAIVTSPALSVALTDADGAVYSGGTPAGTNLYAADSGTAGVDMASTATAATAQKYDGVYGIVAYTHRALDSVTASTTNVLRVRYGATQATATIAVYAASTADSSTSTLTASFTGQGVLNTSTPYNVPVSTKSATVTLTALTSGSSAVTGIPITFTVAYSGNYSAGDVSPSSSTVTTVFTDSNGKASLTLSNANPVSGAVAVVTATGFAPGTTAGTKSITVNWLKSQAKTITVSPLTGLKVKLKASTVVTATVTDAYGAPVANEVLQPAVSGANALASGAFPTVTTDASGKATFTLTDAAAVAADTDSVSFTAASTGVSGSATYTYVASLPVVSTLSGYYALNESTADASVTTVIPATYIDNSGTALVITNNRKYGAAISAGSSTSDELVKLAFVAKDSAGGVLKGVQVDISTVDGWISGSGSLQVTSYSAVTDSTGLVSFVVGSRKTGKIAFTVTAGGVSTSATISTKNTATTDARFISISGAKTGTALGDLVPVTVSVTDRNGNPVSTVAVSLTATGAGVFAGGATTQTFTTDSTGIFTFSATSLNTAGGTGSYKAAITSSGTDSSSVAGYVGATAVEAGLAAGNSSATLDVVYAEGTNPAADALDAANEATDAANAATDAANAAAEAADAATAAAQDAQAAVAELATQVAALIAGIKAQITTLTNLVIKIQKKVKA